MSETLIEFPCRFPLKIFGEQHEAFAQTMMALLLQYDPSFDAATMEMRASKNARYISLSCTIYTTSKAHLDGVYQALCDHPMVKVVL